MHDPVAVRLRQRFRHFFDDPQRLRDRHPAAVQKPRKILAGDQLHHDKRLSGGGFAVIINAGDVRMIQRGSRARLTQETGAILLVLRRRRGEFDGHLAGQVGIFRQIHHSHAAMAKLAEYAVMGNGLAHHADFPFSANANSNTSSVILP